MVELNVRIDRHQFFVEKIEMLLRGLDNGNLEVDQLEDVQEGIQYHVDDNMVRQGLAADRCCWHACRLFCLHADYSLACMLTIPLLAC